MNSSGRLLLGQRDGVCVLKLEGELRLSLAPTLAAFVDRIGVAKEIARIVIDVTAAQCIDSTMLGLLAKIALRSQEVLNAVPVIVSDQDDITRVLQSMGFEDLFLITSNTEASFNGGGELPSQLASEEVLREQVIDAHRVLMSLNDANEEAFRDLVESLEHEQPDSQPPVRAVR